VNASVLSANSILSSEQLYQFIYRIAAQLFQQEISGGLFENALDIVKISAILLLCNHAMG